MRKLVPVALGLIAAFALATPAPAGKSFDTKVTNRLAMPPPEKAKVKAHEIAAGKCKAAVSKTLKAT
jgi:hypothetical protein